MRGSPEGEVGDQVADLRHTIDSRGETGTRREERAVRFAELLFLRIVEPLRWFRGELGRRRRSAG